jgi:hypothetical protein
MCCKCAQRYPKQGACFFPNGVASKAIIADLQTSRPGDAHPNVNPAGMTVHSAADAVPNYIESTIIAWPSIPLGNNFLVEFDDDDDDDIVNPTVIFQELQQRI